MGGSQAELLAGAVARSPSIARLEIAQGALRSSGRVYRELWGNAPALLIADENTWEAAGEPVEAALQERGAAVRRHVLPRDPRLKPDRALGEALAEVLEPGETPVAIGSGVLNDVVKYAAFQRRVRYLCIATAASMDGYTSAGAPLSDRGFKKTIQCRPPSAVIGDLDVIATAPSEMAGWGYGDLAGKVPAGADWIVADALGIEPIDDVAWPMVQDNLRDGLGNPQGVAGGDRSAVADLFTGLALIGLAMEAHDSSRPASGGDHQIAHLWEMEGLSHGGEPVSHGSCVAVGCIAMLRLYDWLLGRDLTALDAEGIVSAAPDMAAKSDRIRQALGTGEVADRAVAETEAKHLDAAAHRRRLSDVGAAWPALRDRLRGQLLSPSVMVGMLSAAGAAVNPQEIGVTPEHLRRTVSTARFIRSRYTLLDLLDETGLFDRAVAEALP